MLKNHDQPCGDQEVLCHVTSPHGSVPPNQAIKGSDQIAPWL